MRNDDDGSFDFFQHAGSIGTQAAGSSLCTYPRLCNNFFSAVQKTFIPTISLQSVALGVEFKAEYYCRQSFIMTEMET